MGNWFEDPGPSWNEWYPSVSESKVVCLSWSYPLLVDAGERADRKVTYVGFKSQSENALICSMLSEIMEKNKSYFYFSFSHYLYIYFMKNIFPFLFYSFSHTALFHIFLCLQEKIACCPIKCLVRMSISALKSIASHTSPWSIKLFSHRGSESIS